jgi:flavin-dependent dehydrogenase
MRHTQYDVVILGGGPSGLATAINIASNVLTSNRETKILLIDQQPLDHQRIGENVPSETLVLLQKLGVDAQFAQGGHEPCPDFASVWGGKQVDYNEAVVNPYGHSWRLNRHAFDLALVNKAVELGVEMLWHTRFIKANKRVQSEHDGYEIYLQTDAQDMCVVQADYVVDATGSKATFAKGQNVKKTVDDKLIAIVRFTELQQPHKGKQVRIEATANNWCYHSLLPQQKAMSMLIADPTDRKLLEKNDYHGFKSHLAKAPWVGDQLNEIKHSNEHYHTYMITSGVLDQVEDDNWIAVGDAASSFDPVAAQGIYKGMRHGIFAAEVISAKLKRETSNINYSDMIQQDYRQYLRNRAHIYQLEQRWPNSEFWQRRSKQEQI